MKVILLTDVKKVGQRGTLVTVADGFGMNVLVPSGKAVPATADNLKRYEASVKEAKGRADGNAARAAERMAQINGKELVISAKMSETGTLFKALHESDIVAEIKKQWGIDLPVSAIALDHPIKQKGTHQVPITLSQKTSQMQVLV